MLEWARTCKVMWESVVWLAVSMFNVRQWHYNYRLLAALNTQLPCNIVTGALRDRDEQAQPEEQWEDDNTWTQPGSGRPITLKHCSAVTIWEGTDTQAATTTENTEWVEPEVYKENVPP